LTSQEKIMISGERTITDVVQDIIANVHDIVRSEFRLARTEVHEEIARARSAGLLLAIGAVASMFSVLFLLLAGVYGLSRVLPDWAAALIVATAVAIVAALTLAAGIKRLKTVQPAPKTAESVKENIQWAKQQTR
jgi:cytochrome c biogenesis protein CcdA